MEEKQYSTKDFADNIIDKNVHITVPCFNIDIKGTVQQYDEYRGEIIYLIKTECNAARIGSKTPKLNIEVLD